MENKLVRIKCSENMKSQVEHVLSVKNKTLFVIGGLKFYFQKLLCNNIEKQACCKRSCKS